MKIYFTSGKIVERDMTPVEVKAMVNRMGASGIRFYDMRDGRYIPLNSNTIELIESDSLKVAKASVETIPPKVEVEEIVDREDPEATFEQEKLESPPTREEKADKMLKEMFEKSNCTHKDQVLCTVGSKKGDRFFYLCSFCGWRGRFIKADSLTQEQRDNAKEYKAS